jgi:hypothetical protein
MNWIDIFCMAAVVIGTVYLIISNRRKHETP